MRLTLQRATCVAVLLFLFAFHAASAHAQQPDAVGIRAQGMAGAFTAVADDATATWWNPAGLATGAYFNAIVEYSRLTETDHGQGGVAVAFPALGLSYYHMTVSQIQPQPSTGAPAGSRQDPGTPSVQAVDLSQFGATIGQSIGGHLVVASTLKLLNASGDTTGGLDIGAMAAWGSLRLGVTARNLREPTFGQGDASVTLRRQVRVGASVATGSSGSFAVATLAVDADVLDVSSASGDERRIAGGGEIWLWKRLIGARAGVSASTIGEARTSVSGGGSLMVHRGLFIEGRLTGGSDLTRRGWGAAFRATF